MDKSENNNKTHTNTHKKKNKIRYAVQATTHMLIFTKKKTNNEQKKKGKYKAHEYKIIKQKQKGAVK